jgi:hypothetical protein
MKPTLTTKSGPVLIVMEMRDVLLQRFLYVQYMYAEFKKKVICHCLAASSLSPNNIQILHKFCTKTVYIWLSQVVVDDWAIEINDSHMESLLHHYGILTTEMVAVIRNVSETRRRICSIDWRVK